LNNTNIKRRKLWRSNRRVHHRGKQHIPQLCKPGLYVSKFESDKKCPNRQD